LKETEDLTGRRFGNLTVIERSDDYIQPNGRRRARWLCLCDCGNTKTIIGESLRGGKTLSCGCLQKKRAAESRTKHGDTDSRLYNVWCAMKRRCNNSSVPEYKNYGGRGIKVCDEWNADYSAFKGWAYASGYDPKLPRGQCTIDRIDVNGDYEPSNCRWVTQKQQMNNVRHNVHIEHNGETHTPSEWAEMYGMNYSTFKNRILQYGYTFDEAVSLRPHQKRITTN